jgi:hypothetical protein
MNMKSPFLPVASLLALLACGGGGGGSSAPAPVPPPSAGAFEGPWTGTLRSTTGATVSATALVLASGEMRYVASNGIQAVGTVAASGNAATGSGTLYAPYGYVFPGNTSSTAFSLSGSGTASVLSGTYTSAYDSGTFAFAYNAGAKYGSPVVMANVAGSYASTMTSSGYPIRGRLTSAGALSGSDAFGTLSGTLTAVDPAKNAFRVNVAYKPTGQAARAYSGLAFFDFSYSPVRLEVQATGAAGQFAAELQLVGL